MRHRKTTSISLSPATPRHWISRVSLVFLLGAGGVLLAMSKQNSAMSEKLRLSLMDAAAPVMEVAASPLTALSQAQAWFSEMADLRAQNARLREENRQLLQWQSTAKSMESENASLRALLHVPTPRKNSFISARIVSDLSGPYRHSALLGAGTAQGVQKDQAVLNERGLLGRIVEAGERSARVLLLTDLNSRVPVMLEGSRQKAILAGANDGLPTLAYLPADATVGIGDRVITSGDGGVFPQGVPVGVVEAVADGHVTVQLFADPSRAEFVSVMDYAL